MIYNEAQLGGSESEVYELSGEGHRVGVCGIDARSPLPEPRFAGSTLPKQVWGG